MCGIAGFVDPGASASDEALARIVGAMSDALAHRGPDGSGVWTDARVGVALGHRRLAVIDPSAEGSQPMKSRSGRYVVVFNGEIYNFRALRRELESLGETFRGHSDTEVLLASIERWGLVPTLERSNGMFSFALWDAADRALHFSRDRLGEKPLYYGSPDGHLLFASELKAFKRVDGFSPSIDRGALTLLLRHKYIPAPHSIYQGVKKLAPGTLLTLRQRDGFRLNDPVPYWTARDAVDRGLRTPFGGSFEDATDELDALLGDAVETRLEADVPLGAFLSGGIDSSTVVALMQSRTGEPVKTFTVSLGDAAFDESASAKRVATHLGTDHTELHVSAADALQTIDRLPQLYDEPFSDSSQIPTFLISEQARRHVTVALSGDGGDELFGGYNRHAWVERIARRTQWMPWRARRLTAAAIKRVSPSAWDRAFGATRAALPKAMRHRVPGDKMQKLADVLAAKDAADMYRTLVSHWAQPSQVVVDAEEPLTLLTDRATWPALPTLTEQIMYLDAVTYLPDDILAKVDRASMGVSLEVRVPLLDHRVFEFVCSLPLNFKVAGGSGKRVLRAVLRRYVPAELTERPKSGFSIPLAAWLRGPLRDWAESLLDPTRIAADGLMQPEPIRRAWTEHLSGRSNNAYQLWDVLMLNAWIDGNRRDALAGAHT